MKIYPNYIVQLTLLASIFLLPAINVAEAENQSNWDIHIIHKGIAEVPEHSFDKAQKQKLFGIGKSP